MSRLPRDEPSVKRAVRVGARRHQRRTAFCCRVYDYLLGGGHSFAADRAVAEKVLRAQPNGRQIASSNRAFLRQAVLHMVDHGIAQFLDLGSGIPTVGNAHEVAQAADPTCRVTCVDNDEVAVGTRTVPLDR